jgi:uncharacterized membrane protein YkvA (DUF1232 family)
MLERARRWAGALKRDVAALYAAGRDPRTPRAAKAVAFAVAVYALSPIDLIPDFVPVLGYLDDLVIVPFGIWLAVHLVPPAMMAEFRAAAAAADRPWTRLGAAIVIAIWIAGATALASWLLPPASLL